MQFHECPARAIVNVVREAFRLLRPGGTFAMTDNSVYKTIINFFSFHFMLLSSQTLISLILLSAAKVKGPTGIFPSFLLDHIL
jgi:SAM-dependent methyltransferase